MSSAVVLGNTDCQGKQVNEGRGEEKGVVARLILKMVERSR